MLLIFTSSPSTPEQSFSAIISRYNSGQAVVDLESESPGKAVVAIRSLWRGRFISGPQEIVPALRLTTFCPVP